MNELEKNYLEHHGILGQKWGIRRYQNHDGSLTDAGRKRYGIEGERTAKQTQRRLNDLDQAMAYNVHAHNQADIRLSNLSNKAKRKAAKGKELSERDIKKAEKAAKKMAEADAYIKEGQEETKRILESLPETMYFKEKNVLRRSQKFVDMFLDKPVDINTPFGTVTGLVPAEQYVYGKEYKVKNKSKRQLERESKMSDRELIKNIRDNKVISSPDKEQRDHKVKSLEAEKAKRNTDSKLSKQDRLDRAKKNDKWDLDFLETIQNTAFFEEDNTKKLLSEYSKYLDDPDEYKKRMRLAQS